MVEKPDPPLTVDITRHAVIFDHLLPGERIRWIGKPLSYRGLMFDPMILLFVVGIPLFLFLLATFAPNMRDLRGATIGSLAPIMLCILGLIGIGLLLSAVNGVVASVQLTYSVTNWRVLIFERRLRGVKVVAYNLPLHIERRDRANGKGDLIFTNTTLKEIYSEEQRTVFHDGFYGIKNVVEVERLIMEALPGSTTKPWKRRL